MFLERARRRPKANVVEMDEAGLSRPTSRRPRIGRQSLAANGGALVVNVFVSGVGGFVFWIVTARSADPRAVAEATALVNAMFGILVISQQTFVLNMPPLIAAAPFPAALLRRGYAWSVGLTALAASFYVAIGPVFAEGLAYLRSPAMTAIFVGGCVIWAVFSLQDAALAGIYKGHLVLAENTVWSLLRLALIIVLPLIGLTIDAGWIIATWLLPAIVMVVVVNAYLFRGANAPLRSPLGARASERRTFLKHMGFEQLTAMGSGSINLLLPAVVLTSVGSADAAAFLTAYSFIIVGEAAIGSFSSAFGVEVRRAGTVRRKEAWQTFGALATLSLGAIGSAAVFGHAFMGLLGAAYREVGGDVLMVLVLGLPFRAVALVSASVNRAFEDGWRNFVQQLAYVGATVICFVVSPVDDAISIAIALVIGRAAAAAVAGVHLKSTTTRSARLAARDAAAREVAIDEQVSAERSGKRRA